MIFANVLKTRAIRKLAIIAHDDHGETTPVDHLLRQSGAFHENQQLVERVMKSNDQVKEHEYKRASREDVA